MKHRHKYRLVNNRYLNGKPVSEGGEWKTEKRCEICDELLPTFKSFMTQHEKL